MKYSFSKKALALSLGVFALFLSVSVIHADPIIFNGPNQVKYTDLENEYDSTGAILPAGTPLAVGDLLQGVIYATTIQQGANQLSPGVNSQQITGVFSYYVTAQDTTSGSFILVANNATNNPNYATTGSILSGLGLPANTMIALYTSPSNTFLSQLSSASTTGQVQTAAETGQLFGAFGYGFTTYADLGSPNPGGYQFSNSSNQFFLGQNLLASDILTTTPITNPALAFAGSTIPAGTLIANNETGGTTKYDLVGQGNVQTNVDSSNPIRSDLYNIQSNDPVNIDVSLVPEPSSLLLCGIGFGSLSAVQLFRRRRNRKEAV